MIPNSVRYITDNAHGWLRVPKDELKRLGVLSEISSYSYEDKSYIYLEEDLDMEIYLSKISDEDLDTIEQEYQEGDSPIRKLKPYKGGLN